MKNDDQIKSAADVEEALEEAKTEAPENLSKEAPVEESTQSEVNQVSSELGNQESDQLTGEPVSQEETTQEEPAKDAFDTDEAEDESQKPQEAGSAQLSERGGGKKLQGHIVIKQKDDPNAHWYVVHTTSGHEARIAENLRQRVETMSLQEYVLEILIPTQDRVVIRSGKKYTVKEKIFPGYMIVKMILTDEAWLCVRTTQGVTGFVGAGNKPSPLSETEVENITKFVAAPAARYKVRFSVGEAVKITDGPFSQFLGTINEMDEERGKVKVLVSIFGRETPVELDFLQIAKA